MRLIDADRFVDQMNEELFPELIKEYGEEEAIKGLHFSFQDCIYNIECQPTIEERKTGRWIPYGEVDAFGNQYYNCSECQCGETHVPTVKVNYCWNCGAKMERKEDGN